MGASVKAPDNCGMGIPVEQHSIISSRHHLDRTEIIIKNTVEIIIKSRVPNKREIQFTVHFILVCQRIVGDNFFITSYF